MSSLTVCFGGFEYKTVSQFIPSTFEITILSQPFISEQVQQKLRVYKNNLLIV